MSNERLFRLCGELEGRWESFPLVAGDNHVGSLPSNDLCLRESGVSRHHAVLEVDGDDIVLVDLASKNGTLVNQKRVGRVQLEEGDEVTFGRRTLRLEALAPDEAELAISFRASRPRDASSQLARDTTHVASGTHDATASPFHCAPALAERLCERDGPDVGGALDIIRDTLDARACLLLEHREGDRGSTMVAASGAADDALWAVVSRRFMGTLAGRPPDDTPPLTPGCVIGEGGRALGLWVAEPGVADGEALLRFTLLLVSRLVDAHAPRPAREGAALVRDLVLPEGHVPGRGPAMTHLYEQLRALAQGDVPALILGETGVGKEHLAHIVHASSTRSAEPFVAVNCAAVPNDLLEAELFGVAAGAATGVSAREGTFRRAHRGTLFLDEIGDMSPSLQAKLLRALQEREVQPVGGRVARVDVRVVAATNVDLPLRIESGRFRADLYYRLAGFTLDVPPLRARREDIPSLVEHFVRRASVEIGKPIRGVSVRALRHLMAHDWPGNVRELENEIRRVVYRCRAGQVIDGDLVRLSTPHAVAMQSFAMQSVAMQSATIQSATGVEPEPDAASAPPEAETLDLATLERRAIIEALTATGGVGVKAARLLGISRDALRRRIERHGLRPADPDGSG